jgi:hypothetical protein
MARGSKEYKVTVITDKFNALLFGGLNLGSPLAEEETLRDGGMKQRFEFGTIYFHPQVGEAFECHGTILQAYTDLGEQYSGLGYPVSDEEDDPSVAGGRWNQFEFGQLNWNLNEGTSVGFDASPEWTPRLVVKLRDEITVNLSAGEVIDLQRLGEMMGFPLAGSAEISVRRLFDPVSSSDIQELIDRAQAQDPDYAAPNFENYLVIDCPLDFDPGILVDTFQQLPAVVEYDYVSPVLDDPAILGVNNPLFAQQGHLDPVSGINVQAVWANGGDGSGAQLIDIERGWALGHHDLPGNIALLDGRNDPEGFTHGCAVLGIVVGVDDNKGIVGIAPKADVALISRVSRQGVQLTPDQAAPMILKAALLMDFGGVILCEMTASSRPIEILPPIFDAIKLATSAGISVVEAGGNGGANLDEFTDDRGRHVLSRDVPAEFRDSGAIVVGASRSSPPHVRLDFSSFGSRVDCFAWGENIVTTGSVSQPTDPDAFLTNFGGTSGASAIIAGVCLLVQDLQLKLQPVSGLPLKLPPLELRRVVSDARNGIASFLVSDRIGVMPNMQKIIVNEYIIPIL